MLVLKVAFAKMQRYNVESGPHLALYLSLESLTLRSASFKLCSEPAVSQRSLGTPGPFYQNSWSLSVLSKVCIKFPLKKGFNFLQKCLKISL